MVNGFDQGKDENLSPGFEGGNFLKPYHKPMLEELGDLRDITLGGSPGSGESGHMYTKNEKPYSGPAGSHSTHGNNLPNLLDLQKTQQPKKR